MSSPHNMSPLCIIEEDEKRFTEDLFEFSSVMSSRCVCFFFSHVFASRQENDCFPSRGFFLFFFFFFK